MIGSGFKSLGAMAEENLGGGGKLLNSIGEKYMDNPNILTRFGNIQDRNRAPDIRNGICNPGNSRLEHRGDGSC
jgi:hypothetical protein